MRKLANMMSVAPFAYGLGIKALVTGSGQSGMRARNTLAAIACCTGFKGFGWRKRLKRVEMRLKLMQALRALKAWAASAIAHHALLLRLKRTRLKGAFRRREKGQEAAKTACPRPCAQEAIDAPRPLAQLLFAAALKPPAG